MRALRLTTILMITALILATPAMAQESGTDTGAASARSQQYGVDSAESLADGIRDASENAGRGADAVNDALADARSPDEATDSPRSEVAGLTMLPATGGVSPLVPCAGALLVMAGLTSLVRRTVH